MDVLRDELLGFFHADGGYGGEEVDEFFGVVPGGVEEVEAVGRFADVDRVAVGGMFEDELFEVEKGSFVGDLLADLNDGAPGICGEGFGAVGTLVVCNDIFYHECLLDDRP